MVGQEIMFMTIIVSIFKVDRIIINEPRTSFACSQTQAHVISRAPLDKVLFFLLPTTFYVL